MAGGRRARARNSRPARNGRRGRNGASRRRGDMVLAQGVAAPVGKAFGASLVKVPRFSMYGWDAFNPHHTPLPRATAPYTVVRTTSLFTSSAKYIQFGTFVRDNAGDQANVASDWTNVIAVEDGTASTPINDPNNAYVRTVPFPGVPVTGSAITVTPAAISVQVMNPEALQSTSGIIAAAACNTQLDVRNRTETWDDLASEVISYMKPRLLSAGKLALRGVHVNSYPMNMSEISDFKPLANTADGFRTWNVSDVALRACGFAPIVVVNSSYVGLQFLVTVEWRVRFDIGNPAVASHVHHGVTPDNIWNKMLETASAAGHGVKDIADVVANAGEAVSKFRSAFGRGPRAIANEPLIVD